MSKFTPLLETQLIVNKCYQYMNYFLFSLHFKRNCFLPRSTISGTIRQHYFLKKLRFNKLNYTYSIQRMSTSYQEVDIFELQKYNILHIYRKQKLASLCLFYLLRFNPVTHPRREVITILLAELITSTSREAR